MSTHRWFDDAALVGLILSLYTIQRVKTEKLRDCREAGFGGRVWRR